MKITQETRNAIVKLITGTSFLVGHTEEDYFIFIRYNTSNSKYEVYEIEKHGKSTNTAFARVVDAVDYFLKLVEDADEPESTNSERMRSLSVESKL